MSGKPLLPLYESVVKDALDTIDCWYEAWGGNVYVAFSGGWDSTVLLDLVRSNHPEVVAVFNNTGLEWPEVVKFVRTFDNVIELRPKMPFHKVIEKFGYPVVSKEQSQFIYEYRNTKSKYLRDLRFNGRANGRSKISEKWKFLIDAPFGIGHHCCNKLKKEPAKKFEKSSGLHPMLGIRASEGQLRAQRKGECNAYDIKRPISKPLLRWADSHIERYIKENKLRYCELYDQGFDRTGCMFCLYGIHKDSPNKFQSMKISHPKMHEFCMNKLGIKEVLDFLGLPSEGG
jgi:3'-phosphoadenosine 5'-phosphosulfate sulfotransferase (PAPS reductase)/FAD synthetase